MKIMYSSKRGSKRMNIYDDIAVNILLRDDIPVDDFLGLIPTKFYYLLYDPFGNKSPVQLRDDIDDKTLNQIPLFRILEEYLKIIKRDKQIKLTPLGALPQKILVELYNKRFLLEELIERGTATIWRERDCIAIRSARLAAEYSGLVKKRNFKLTLTKLAIKLLETNKRLQIFKHFFLSFTGKFVWSFNDFYPQQPIGQLGWAFSIMMLNKFGSQPRMVDFYAYKYLKAFPDFITFFQPDYSTPEKQFIHCYGLRTFKRFFLWFGFVTADMQKNYLDLDTDKFKRTDLVERIFKIED